MSGADDKTTAPKAADKGEDAAPEATAPMPEQPPAPNPIPVPKPAPTVRPPKPKVALQETAPETARSFVRRAPGERAEEGDPYLNRIWSMIERHRTYPANAVGSLGLPLEGTSVFLMEIGPDGALLNLELERSAGAAVLDHTAADMIEGAAPFPPPPRKSFPGPTAVLEATIAVYPGSGSALTR